MHDSTRDAGNTTASFKPREVEDFGFGGVGQAAIDPRLPPARCRGSFPGSMALKRELRGVEFG